MMFLYQLYFSLPQFKWLGVFGKAITKISALILKRLLDFYLPSHYLKTSKKAGLGITTQKRAVPIIISVTTFPARIGAVWISMESLLRQTVKPDAIILWLANEQFSDKKIPESLTRLQDRGLTIRYCDDLRSHKKYYYAMREFPEACIITFDDDLYYDEKVIERLLNLYEQYPDCICTNRAHQIKIENGKVLPYRQWNHNAKHILVPTKTLLPTGGAGTLYPPHSLSESAFDASLIRSLCFHADDVWLKLMATLNGKKSVTHSFYNKDFLTVIQTQNEKLVSQNVFDGGNDAQFENTCKHFLITTDQFID
jgi:hypothetical protein